MNNLIFCLILGASLGAGAECKPSKGGVASCSKEELQGNKTLHLKPKCEYQTRKSGPFCNMYSIDHKTPCTDQSQCQGTCLMEPKSKKGYCSKFVTNYGCYTFLKEGKPTGICVD